MTEASPSLNQSPQNIVIALDGVGGTGILPLSLKAAAKFGGANLKIQRFFWNHGVFMLFHDLLDKEHIERKGAQLAELIDSLYKDDTVQLVAKSGGSRLILGLGTSIFGTSDGVRTTSAGCAGFAIAPVSCLYPAQYSELEQERWRPDMLKQLQNGMHFGNSATPWLLKNIVPRLIDFD
jgi:hypothetical protein